MWFVFSPPPPIAITCLSTDSLNSSLLGSSCREDSNSSQLVHNGSATGAGNVKEERNGLSDRATSSLDGITSTDSVVDEETVLRTVRLSQRCSADAVGNIVFILMFMSSSLTVCLFLQRRAAARSWWTC